MFLDIPGRSGKEQLLVADIFVYRAPFLYIENYPDIPGVTMTASLMCHTKETVIGSAHTCFAYFTIDVSSMSVLIMFTPNLWFPLMRMVSKSELLVHSSIVHSLYREAFCMMYNLNYLSLWYLNSVVLLYRSLNFVPYFSGNPSWDINTSPKFPLDFA